MRSYSIAAKFSSNAAQSTPWKNSARIPVSPATNVTAVKNFRQQAQPSRPNPDIIRVNSNTKSGLSPQGQEIPKSRQSASPMIVGSPPSSGNLRTNSTSIKFGSPVSTLQSKQSENNSAVCGKDVPSKLSTWLGRLSELKH